jgi:hypothetical protein
LQYIYFPDFLVPLVPVVHVVLVFVLGLCVSRNNLHIFWDWGIVLYLFLTFSQCIYFLGYVENQIY